MKKIIFLICFFGFLFAQQSRIVGVDPSGNNTRIVVNSMGHLIPSNVMLEIPKGSIPNTYSVNKFGRAPSGVQTTATDIWDRANATPTQQVWTAPTQARVHAIVSTSDEDSTGNSGALTIQVYGLTSWDSKEISEVITMDGTNAVNTDSSYVIIHRMKVLTNGGTNINTGVITATAATDGTVTAQINAGQGQTQMAIYGIPSTQSAYVTCYYFSLHDSNSPSQSAFADVELLVNTTPNSTLSTFLTKHTQGVATFGTSYIRHCYTPYFKITGPAIIKMQSTGSAADLDASAGFDLILMDN